MMYRVLCALFLMPFISNAQVDLSYYLPDETYNPAIPVPASVIGHEVGEYHITHDKLVYYMQQLAAASDRITIRETGKTFEGRPQLLLTITSTSNHARLDQIRTDHMANLSGETTGNENQPVIVYMGFSIHGNEPSGSNASMLTAYYLAATENPEMLSRLENAVILLDPSFNPDGLQRFASWVNSKKGQIVSADPNNLEQNEPWPRGRTNHYWFDLNRDWLPAQLPESRARLAVFHEWKPNVLTDHHEMGTNSTYFFQPGIPSRNNPLTPERNFELTREIGRYHAAALDSIGSLYYTQESFDDFYYGKGSTYPDINGGIGILFEQASSRGHAQESVNGILRFPFTVKNQFNTSLSTLRAATNLRTELLDMQRDFYQSAGSLAGRSDIKAYLVASKDKWKIYHFGDMLRRHQIQFYLPDGEERLNGQTYSQGELLLIESNQPQHRLITTMFEKRTSFTDSLFYDVSAWHMPSAFGVDYTTWGERQLRDFNGSSSELEKPRGQITPTDYAYAIEWQSYYAPGALYALLEADLNVKVATAPFNGSQPFPRGTLILPVNNQEMTPEEIHELLSGICEKFGLTAHGLATGLDYQGKSLGSPSMAALEKPKIALLVGGGVSSYEAGEIWHLLDDRMKMPVTLLEVDRVKSTDLSRYNTIIMVNGSYTEMEESGRNKLKQWLENGGTVIAVKRALSYLNTNGMGNFKFRKTSAKDSVGTVKSYSDISADMGAQQLGGSIFEAAIDPTHPLLYGYTGDKIAIFKNDRMFMENSRNAFANPIRYTDAPLIGGYISAPTLELLKGTAVAGVSRVGRGRVIGLTADMNFRAFWYGTNRIFLNALFFGPVISNSSMR